MLWLLHAVSNLSQYTAARDTLEQEGFIPILVRLLARKDEFTVEELKATVKAEDITLAVRILFHVWKQC